MSHPAIWQAIMNIAEVMAAQKDLVNVVQNLKQIQCVKG
jgi:hypothetical protein